MLSSRVESPAAILQAARFSIVGITNTLIDAAIFFALTQGLAVPVLSAKWISYSSGLANSYYWNRRWTFREARLARQAAFRFVALNLAGLLVNASLLALGLDILHLPLQLGWLVATGGSWLWNFWGSKQLVFKS
jgi:putative flippase GtrA